MQSIYIIETIAVAFTIISVVLAMKKHIHTWSIGIVGIIGYMTIFYTQKLYADFGLQFIFLIQSIIGYVFWNKNTQKLIPFKIISKEGGFLISSFLFMGMTIFFASFTKNPQPFLDSLATTLSIIATYLLMYKKTYNWLVWMFADVIYVLLFLTQRLYLSASLYIVLFFIAYYAYKNWKLLNITK